MDIALLEGTMKDNKNHKESIKADIHFSPPKNE